MQHLDEGTIHAWLDGELPAAERAAADAHVAQCAECAAAVAEARGFIAASSRILTALDAVPGGVLPAASARAPDKRFTIPRAWMAVAAALVVGIGTVIALRSPHDVAALRVAETRQDSKTANVAPSVATVVADSAVTRPAAPAREFSGKVQAEKGLTGGGAPKPAAKDEAHNVPARAEELAETGRDAKRAAAVVQQQPAMIAQSPAAPAASAMESDSAAPQFVSRNSTVEGADTIVTTVYTVRGVRVSLIERPAPAELQGAATNFNDAVMAKARAQAPPENSITWSDSTGRTRTLRGALSHEALERLKARLFGATP